MRNRYLIAYDVADDKRRNRIFKTLMGNGDHVQFSVFLCDLSDVELARIKGSLTEAINQRQDQIIVLNLGPADSPVGIRLECIGMAYSPPARVMVI
ncbi:MAG: CRISPR-associated endonuclease Cas2 [Planctomycetota bacterium]|nr:CRISPR-associated endonuclease Cas2 [Planctomycetota bacterium]